MQKIALLGMGRVGIRLLDYLMGKNVKLFIYDANSEKFAHRRVAFAIESGKAVRVTDTNDLLNAELIIKSPGIPNRLDWIEKLDKAGIPIIDEIEYVYRELNKPFTIAITGTNGKSTTTAWIAHLLKTAGKRVFCGGNLAPGKPFSDALQDSLYDVYVIEISSFQLERCPSFKPNIAVLLNIASDHLNRHSQEEYANLKFSLFKNHDHEDIAVLNIDDNSILKRIDTIKGIHINYSLYNDNATTYLKESKLYYKNDAVIGIDELPLPGLHNASNALAVIAVASELELSLEQIRQGLRTFKGLRHRMQYLGKLEGREVYNNSMCTNPKAFYHSVHSFKEASVIIAGGTEKDLPLEPFIDGIKERAKYLILFGQNAKKLEQILKEQAYFSSCITVDSLRAAIDAALRHSSKGDRILFSPGFASFGTFRNFEERGNEFIKAYRENK